MSAFSALPVYPSTKRMTLALGLASALLSPIRVSALEAGGPFAKFIGSWRGSGEVASSDGTREPIHCRANGSVSGRGETLMQTLVCASDSYRFDIRTHIVADGDSVHGDWQETTRDVSGSVRGRIIDGRFSGAVSGAGFSASTSLRADGHRQVFSLRPHHGDVARVDVVLTR